MPFASLELDPIVPDATLDSLIHRQFVRDNVGSICHEKAVYSDFIGRKSVLRVCYGIFEREEI